MEQDISKTTLKKLIKVKKINFYAKNPAYVSDLAIIEKEYERLAPAHKKSFFIKRNEIKITGKELLDLGVKQEEIGESLDKIYNDILAGKVKNTPDKLIAYTVNNLIA